MSATVSIVRGKEPDKMVMEVVRLLGGLESIVSGQNAVIKPNLGPWFPTVVPRFVNRWATTKPEIVVAMVKELRKIGVNDVSVAEGAFLDLDATAQFEESGMKNMVEEAGGKVIDLDRGGHVRVSVAENFVFEIGKSVLNTDNLINMPVMKTHTMTRLSLGIKNLKGTVSKASKRAMHRGDLERSIAFLSKTLRPKLTIVDGLVGMEGLGPAVAGKPKNPGLLVGGTDPVAVDAVTATIMGHDPKEIEHIKIASELGLGEINVDRIKILGVPLEKAKHPFEPAPLGAHNMIGTFGMQGVRYFGWTPGVIGSECTGCIDTVMSALWALRSDVATIQRPLDIVIGPRGIPDEIGNNVLLYGNCQAKNRNRGKWLPGCPPSTKDAYMSIGKMGLSRPTFGWALTKRLFKGQKTEPLSQWKRYEI